MSACLSQIRKYNVMYTKWSMCSSDTVVVIHINNRLALVYYLSNSKFLQIRPNR